GIKKALTACNEPGARRPSLYCFDHVLRGRGSAVDRAAGIPVRPLGGRRHRGVGAAEDAVGRPLAEVAHDYRIALLVNGAFERQVETHDELTEVVGARTVTARAIPLAGQGHVDVAVVLRDQTRLRQLETVRRDFVANVSHELRTPVTAIHLLV